MQIYGVTGWKNAGKTGLMEGLIADIYARGFSVSTIKHAHHETDIDQPGRDSHRHRSAGAGQVMLTSPHRWALMTELRGTKEPSLDNLLARLDPVDLVLIEGYKSAPHPKIEVWRDELGKPPLALQNPSIRALAIKGRRPDVVRPCFDLDDSASIADFILGEVGL